MIFNHKFIARTKQAKPKGPAQRFPELTRIFTRRIWSPLKAPQYIYIYENDVSGGPNMEGLEASAV